MWSFIRRISLVQWIFVALIAGIAFGANFPEAASNLKILSTIFLRMIKSIVAPMIFGTLVVGIAGHGDDVRRIGRLAWRSFLYFELATTIALFVGLGAAHLVQPGVGIALTGSVNEAKEFASKSSQVTFSGVLEHMIPQSFFEAAAHNEVLQVVFFAVIFAIALTQVKPGPAKETVLNFCEGLSQTMFKFTGIIMNYAPIGIGAAIGYVVGQSGLGVLWNLGKLVLTLYGALAVFILGVLIPIRKSPCEFKLYPNNQCWVINARCHRRCVHIAWQLFALPFIAGEGDMRRQQG